MVSSFDCSSGGQQAPVVTGMFVLILPSIDCALIVHCYSFITTAVSISQEELVCAMKKASLGPSPSAYSHSKFAKLIENGGVDIILPADIPGQKPVLTVEQQVEMRRKCGNDEHMLIAIMTPVLVAVCAAVGASFVNSDEQPWIPTESNDPANFLEPDAFSSVFHVHSVSEEHRVHKLGDFRRELVAGRVFEDVYQFGCPIWELRDIYVAWEFKLSISPEHRGIAYNYVVNLSRGDAYNTYFVVLCDCDHFYIISAKNGTVSSRVNKYAWTSLGSVGALHWVLSHKNARVRLLQGLCADLRVEVADFLGAGATGCCFSVRDTSITTVGHKQLRVLKAVLTCHRDTKRECACAEALAVGEFRKLEVLAAVSEPEPLPVVGVVPGSLARVYHEGVLLGVRYLMPVVGKPIVPLKISRDTLKLLFASLSALHRRGHYHGEARIQNAVFVRDRQVVWIDFVWGSDEPVGANDNRKKLDDVVALIDSIFAGNLSKTDGELRELLNRYGASLSLKNAECIAAHLVGLPQAGLGGR